MTPPDPADPRRCTVLLLHPGAMGSALGANLVSAGHRVLWDPTGRSPASHDRAGAAGLEPVDLGAGVRRSDVVLCSCAPQGALDLARRVGALGFTGTFVEANPLAPATLAAARTAVGGRFVDAALIGGPPTAGGGTQILLSGAPQSVGLVSGLWDADGLTAVPLGDTVGAASAAKAAYALYNKGRLALAVLAHRLAEHHGVGAVLRAQAGRRDASALGDDDLDAHLRDVAWRWGPEFDELAATLDAAGLDPAVAHALRAVWAGLEDP